MDKLSVELNSLKELDKCLDNCDKQLSVLTGTKEIEDKIEHKLTPKEKADLNWSWSYGPYTCYYLHLLLNEIHPKDHALMKEIKRLQEYKKKISHAVKGEDAEEQDNKTNINNKNGRTYISKRKAEQSIQDVLLENSNKNINKH